ncbi:restriction endonuclease subunit S [Paenibacillus alvei]|uniref:restriction endonuclease subunit S n=1 Tax=Paenibacillus alvei TaxID=44250 RepID=UPI00228140E4|nr:restriction endonuclease subunit S [Paenibacillus alvei]
MSFDSVWEKQKLNDLCLKIGSGSTPTGGKESYKQSGISLIRSQNIYNHFFAYEGLAFIDENQAKKLDNVTIQEDDVLLNITGDSVCRCCIVPKEVLPARVNQHVSIIRVDRTKIHPFFVKSILTTNAMQGYMLSLAQAGGTRHALTKGMIQDFDIPVPELNEQKKIVDILSSLDDKIELNNVINKNLEEMAQALFKRWFVDFEFPNENGEPYKSSGGEFEESELGLIPKGWRVGSLGDIAQNRKETVKPENIPSGTVYIGLEHIPKKQLSLNNFGMSDSLESNKVYFRKYDVLFGKLRPYFHKVSITSLDGVCSTDIIPIYSTDDDYYGYLVSHLFSDNLIKAVTNSSNGTRMPRTKWKDIAEYSVYIPDRSISSKFNLFFKSVVKQMNENVHSNRSLSQIRDTLLPKLMSGEIRVPLDQA